MIDLDAWKIRIAFLVAIWCGIVAGSLAYQNYTLTQSNAELSHFIGSKLDSLEVVQARLAANQLAGFEALRVGVGSRVADSIVRMIEK